MERKPHLDSPTHSYSFRDKPPLMLAEMLGERGVIIGETSDLKIRPIFVPEPIKSLFETTLQHPTVVLLRAAYDLHTEKPEGLSPEQSILFDDIRRMLRADRYNPVVKHYVNHVNPVLRRKAEQLRDSAIISNSKLTRSISELKQNILQKLRQAMEETQLVLQEQSFSDQETAS